MSAFSKRPDELLKEMEVFKSLLPEQAAKNFQDAIAKYRSWRNEALDDLLEVLEKDNVGDSARTWIDQCNRARADGPRFFENALNNIVLGAEAAANLYRWQLTIMANEAKFFEALGKANAAQVRDYLCANRESLRKYTSELDQKWRAILDEDNKLQSEEQKHYDEMLAMTNRIVEELAMTDRALKEQAASWGGVALTFVEKLGVGETAAVALNLPSELGALADKVAETTVEPLKKWVDTNSALRGREANYRALVQAEKGGVLPLFKETRKQVYEYWDKNKIEVAKDWLQKFRSSLESEWVTACPTPGQQDDAKDFYKAAFERVDKHLKAVESVAKEFEDKWAGVFKGALAPKTVDELVDSTTWRTNAETLISRRTPAVINDLLDNMDGYYEESFEKPLAKLKDKAEDVELSATAREETVRAVEEARKRVEQSVRARIKLFQREVAASLRWFEPDEIKKMLDHSALEDALK